MDESNLRNVLAKFWSTMSARMGAAHLDHFWMYVDKKKGATEEKTDE